MHESLVKLPGQRLALDEYYQDYETRFWQLKDSGTWKIERQQEFNEPGQSSWEAFSRGDWSGALKILEKMRPALVKYFQRVAEQGSRCRRVRVVEEPISPYLVWELNGLLIRQQCGEQVRVVGREQVEAFEREDSLPEILILGTETVYQVLYGENGAPDGSIRSTDGQIVAQWTQVAEELYESGEELKDFFARKVSVLRPPGGM
jgi:hypothetical protein